MKEVLIATNNKGKKKDFEALFNPFGVTVLTLNDLDTPIEVEETGVTFEENALLKAETVAKLLGKIVIADDSGLEIDALQGEPGVYSARYAGPNCTDDDNIDKVLKNLVDVPKTERSGRFVCVLAVAGPDIPTTTYRGECNGLILNERIGNNGFGYDPIFYIEHLQKSMAQLSANEKSAISHRGAALEKMKEDIPSFFKQ